jgi:hypothetical protein
MCRSPSSLRAARTVQGTDGPFACVEPATPAALAAFRAGANERAAQRLSFRGLRPFLAFLLYLAVPAGAPTHGEALVAHVLPATLRALQDEIRAHAVRVDQPSGFCRCNQPCRVSILRSGKRHAIFYVTVHHDSPNGDDTTSNDPDDDDDNDSSHDLRYDSDTDNQPLALSCEALLDCLDCCVAEPALGWPEFPFHSCSIASGQRLRC